MKRIKTISIVLLCLFVLIGLKEAQRLYRYKQKARSTEIFNINIAEIKNGIYQAEYDMDYVGITLSLEVKDGAVKDIRILNHKHQRGKKAEEVIPGRIIEKQSVQVDAVTGATNSSIAIMKAAELALKKGI